MQHNLRIAAIKSTNNWKNFRLNLRFNFVFQTLFTNHMTTIHFEQFDIFITTDWTFSFSDTFTRKKLINQ